MMNNFLRNAVVSVALCGIFVTAIPAAPAKANTTTTILLGAAALAGIATAINVENKHREAGTIVGYLSNGDPVYQDGHIVGNNGQIYYPGNNGQQVSCNGQQCYLVAANTNNGYNNGGYYGNNGGYQNGNNGGYYGNNGGYQNGSNGGYYGNNGGYQNNGDARGRRDQRARDDHGPGHS